MPYVWKDVDCFNVSYVQKLKGIYDYVYDPSIIFANA